MSRLIANTYRHTGGSADNITLDASQNVTVEGNLTVDGTTTLTGAVTGDNSGKILQVVANNVTSTSETTLASYSSAMSDFVNIAALNTSITTTAADSNILVNLQFCGEPSSDDRNCRWVVSRTISGTTTYFTGASPGSKVPCTGVLPSAHYDANNTNTVAPQTGLINYFDDLGTVSSSTQVDYKLLMESGNGAITYNLNKNESDDDNAGSERTISYFTLIEVAG